MELTEEEVNGPLSRTSAHPLSILLEIPLEVIWSCTGHVLNLTPKKPNIYLYFYKRL